MWRSRESCNLLILQEFDVGFDKGSNSNRLLVFDRDNTLNQDYGYTHKVEDFTWKSGVPELLASLAPLQLNFAIASNQSGIGKGLYSVDAAKTFNSHLVSKAKEFGIDFSVIVFCPHDPKLDLICDCRKPSSGMLIFLSEYFSINLNRMIFIGDSSVDKMAAESAGLVFLDINEVNLLESLMKWIDQ
jgi:D-glycero-D-manno-heptose 1,7-bisphosphate phosphatase